MKTNTMKRVKEVPRLRDWVEHQIAGMRPEVCQAAFGMMLATGRAWRMLERLGVPWEVALRAVQIQEVLPCGLPRAVRGNPDAEGLSALARAAVRRTFLGKGAPFEAWIREGADEWERRMVELREDDLSIDMAMLECLTLSITGAREFADQGLGSFEVILGMTEFQFDDGGWPEECRLSDGVATTGDDDDGANVVLRSAS